MDGWLQSLLQALALPEYGLSTVFVAAFVSATLLPMGSEPVVFGLVKLNPSLFWPAILVATVGNTLAIFLFNVFPYLGVLVATGAGRWLYAATCMALWLLAGLASRAVNARWTTAFAFPLVCLVFIFIQWRSMLLTLVNGGIRWRDTHYPLAELKANRI